MKGLILILMLFPCLSEAAVISKLNSAGTELTLSLTDTDADRFRAALKASPYSIELNHQTLTSFNCPANQSSICEIKFFHGESGYGGTTVSHGEAVVCVSFIKAALEWIYPNFVMPAFYQYKRGLEISKIFKSDDNKLRIYGFNRKYDQYPKNAYSFEMSYSLYPKYPITCDGSGEPTAAAF